MPGDVIVAIAIDRSTTIRASLNDTELTLLITVILVVIVVFFFLRTFRSAIIPAVAVPVSILGTFGGMYVLGYSLDFLSLMALTIATGFVVDDAIVVLENITRHLEAGMTPMRAALLGAREVAFTVLSISVSLIAVFLPVLLMGGILGRLFREFTVTLSLAILVSLVVSLSTAPMMCALLLKPRPNEQRRPRRSLFDRLHSRYERSLRWSLQRSRLVLAILLATIVTNGALFMRSQRAFSRRKTQESVRHTAGDQSISFKAMSAKLRQMMAILQSDPAVDNVVGFTGAASGFGGSTNSASVIVALKPSSQRSAIDTVIARLQPKLGEVPGGHLFLASVQDIHVGARSSNAPFQYTLQSDSVDDLSAWTPSWSGP